MHLLFSILFWTYLAASSIALFFVALVIWLVTLPFDRNRTVLHYFTSFWAYHYVWLNPMWSVRIEGRENLRAAGPTAVLVANHQSLGDILILFGLFWPFKWVSKRSVYAVPFIGWNMRLNGYVPLLRGDKQSIGEMMDRCRHWLRRGASIMMFPEGTRSPDGEVKAFKTGAFTIATESGLPIVPIAIEGTRDALPKHGFVLRTRSKIRVRVLPPVRGTDMTKLLEEVRDRIASEVSAIRTQPA
jgi:1-acyl-sn-glycerol-3-phosphate acyltransferase